MDGGTLEHHGKPGKLRDGFFHATSSNHFFYFSNTNLNKMLFMLRIFYKFTLLI